MIYTHQLSPIALDLGFFAVRWYGIAYILGFILASFWVQYIDKRHHFSKKIWDDFMVWAIIGVVIGGRLGHVLLYYPAYYLANPLEILEVWQGGMAFHGGLLGVIISGIIFIKYKKLNGLLFADYLAKSAPIGLFFGRIANFINGELVGNPTGGDWGVIFPKIDDIPRHPSQLYEALGEGLFLFIFINIIARRAPIGIATGLFLLGYGVLRSAIELTRAEEILLNLPITYGQILNIPLILGGLLILIYAYINGLYSKKI